LSGREAFCPHCGAKLGGGAPAPVSRKSKSKLPIILAIAGVLLLSCCIGTPAVFIWEAKRARTAARESIGQKRSKQLSQGVQDYSRTNQQLPPGTLLDAAGQPMHGWASQLLPFIDHELLYKTMDFNQSWDAPVNVVAGDNVIAALIDPWLEDDIRDSKGLYVSHYGANSQVMRPNQSLKPGEITDGASNTLLLGNMSGNYQSWITPFNVRDPADGWNTGPNSFGRTGKRDGMVVMCDGSVRAISHKIDQSVFKALGTPQGGEKP
jgi:hypothetical protein